MKIKEFGKNCLSQRITGRGHRRTLQRLLISAVHCCNPANSIYKCVRLLLKNSIKASKEKFQVNLLLDLQYMFPSFRLWSRSLMHSFITPSLVIQCCSNVLTWSNLHGAKLSRYKYETLFSGLHVKIVSTPFIFVQKKLEISITLEESQFSCLNFCFWK